MEGLPGGGGSCCAPERWLPAPATVSHAAVPEPAGTHVIEQVEIPAGYFDMGDSRGDGRHADGETPVHRVFTEAYSIDATSVTNAVFADFVAATGYRTEAETFGFSAVFHLAVEAEPSAIIGSAPGTPWWIAVRGADWRHPNGPSSNLDGLADHPVVHVSWNDALEYCAWANRALPTEAQWERAARAGRERLRYPWGDDLDAASGWRCNIWQGSFPTVNTLEDGALTTAPVRSYQPNDWGLWQMVGNVWEWCSDWFHPEYYSSSPSADPAGPKEGVQRALRGGSYLCHDSYCNRYRNAARSSNTPDSSMANAGFRTVSALPLR